MNMFIRQKQQTIKAGKTDMYKKRSKKIRKWTAFVSRPMSNRIQIVGADGTAC